MQIKANLGNAKLAVPQHNIMLVRLHTATSAPSMVLWGEIARQERDHHHHHHHLIASFKARTQRAPSSANDEEMTLSTRCVYTTDAPSIADF